MTAARAARLTVLAASWATACTQSAPPPEAPAAAPASAEPTGPATPVGPETPDAPSGGDPAAGEPAGARAADGGPAEPDQACVEECVRSRQMQATSVEAIEAGCREECRK